MLGWKSSSWFYPKPTGDPGRDRNARTVQFACFLLASAVSTVAILNIIAREPLETPLLAFAVAGLVAAMVMNRAGRWDWAAQTAFLALILTALLLVFEGRDGFRSHAMLLFPGMLLLSVMLLNRASYVITAGIVLVAVAALGIAERQGLTRAIPHRRRSTTYESIFFVDLNLLVFAIIGAGSPATPRTTFPTLVSPSPNWLRRTSNSERPPRRCAKANRNWPRSTTLVRPHSGGRGAHFTPTFGLSLQVLTDSTFNA
jgi:hypothetical protein